MALTMPGSNRREFLKTGLTTGAAALFSSRFARATESGVGPGMSMATQMSAASAAPSKVAVTNGDNRSDNIFRALRSLEKEIAQSVGYSDARAFRRAFQRWMGMVVTFSSTCCGSIGVN